MSRSGPERSRARAIRSGLLHCLLVFSLLVSPPLAADSFLDWFLAKPESEELPDPESWSRKGLEWICKFAPKAARCVQLQDEDAVRFRAGDVHAVALPIYLYISQPQSCVVCYLLTTLVDLVRPLGAASWELLVWPVTVLLGIGFSIALSIGAARIVLSGQSGQWLVLAGSLVRYAVALVVLGSVGTIGATIYESDAPEHSGDLFNEIYCNFIGPAMGLATSTGLILLDTITAVGDPSIPPSSASGDPPKTSGTVASYARSMAVTYLDSTTMRGQCDGVEPERLQGMYGSVVLASGVHTVGTLGLAQGVGYMADSAQLEDEEEGSIIMLFGGALLALMYVLFIITAGLRLVDPILRVMLVCACAPMLVAAWVFAPTRRAAEVGTRALLYAILYLVFAGAVYGLSFVIVAHGQEEAVTLDPIVEEWLRNDKCKTGGSVWILGHPDFPDPFVEPPDQYCYCLTALDDAGNPLPMKHDHRVLCMLRSGGALTYRSPEDAGNTGVQKSVDVVQLVISLIGLMLAQSLIGLAGTFAGALSDYQTGENVAQAAEGQMRGLATSAASTAIYAGIATAGMASRGVFGGVRKSLDKLTQVR